MRSKFTTQATPRVSGRIRITIHGGQFMSLKPSQIHHIQNYDNKWSPKEEWAKGDHKNASAIQLYSASGSNKNDNENRHDVYTDIDTLEKIVDLAEAGYNIDLRPYTGKQAKRLHSLRDLFKPNKDAKPVIMCKTTVGLG
jgi:hypothetical protein